MTFQQFSTHAAGHYFVLRGPHPSRGVLLCPAGPWSVPRALQELYHEVLFGGRGRRAHLPSKFSFSSDFCHFVLKMLVNAKFSFVSRKNDTEISEFLGPSPADFSTAGDASPRPPVSKPVGPWFVPRGPWFDDRGPDPSRGALICIAGPDPSRGTRIRSAEPWCFPRGSETW